MQLYSARWLVPVSSPPIPDGAIAVEGERILAVGRRADLAREFSGAKVARSDLGDVIVMPGPVNAHSHLELAWMADDPPAASAYAAWVAGLLERRRDTDPVRAGDAARQAIAGMVARGTSAIGDIANGDDARQALASAAMPGIAFHEIYGFDPARADAIADAGKAAASDDRQLTAHAPHTTSEPLVRRLAADAASAGRHLSIHVAESREECRLLRYGDGPFVELLERGGMWDPAWRAPGISPVALLARCGALGPRTLAVHAVQIDDADIDLLRSSRAHVVTCPRSNATLGVGVAQVPRLLAAGVPVALGTDSVASAPDLDPFAELAALAATHPSLEPETLIRIATLNGAAALGLADELGSIAPGRAAALVAIPAHGSNDPWAPLLATPTHVAPFGGSRWGRPPNPPFGGRPHNRGLGDGIG